MVKLGYIEKTVDPTGSSMSVWVKERAYNIVREHFMHRKGHELLGYGSLGPGFGAGGEAINVQASCMEYHDDNVLSVYELENALDDDVAFYFRNRQSHICTALLRCSK